jgi:hypothetical protein
MNRPILSISYFCDTVLCFPFSVVVFLACSGFKTKMQDLMAYILVGERTKLNRKNCQLLDEYARQRFWKWALNYMNCWNDSTYEVLVPGTRTPGTKHPGQNVQKREARNEGPVTKHPVSTLR